LRSTYLYIVIKGAESERIARTVALFCQVAMDAKAWLSAEYRHQEVSAMYNRDDRGGAIARRPQEGVSRQRGNDWFWQRDPWQEMQEMQRRMDQLVSGVFGQTWPRFSPMMGNLTNQMADFGVAEPDIDFRETETEYTIQAALPGIAPGDIDVQATVDSIRLTAQTRQGGQSQPQQQTSQDGGGQAGSGQNASQQGQSQMTQHRQGQFSRISRFEFAYSLPEDIKPNEVKANFRHGVLELHLPKANPDTARNKAVSIPIQADSSTAQIQANTGAQQNTQQTAGNEPVNAGAEHQTGARSSEEAAGKKAGAPASRSGASATTNAGTK
jgi:HSP20 family protein